jgi:hypothetical protein
MNDSGYQGRFDMRRAVAIAGITLLVLAGPMFAPAAGAKTTVAFQFTVKYTFGGPASKPCDHFQCGEGTVVGFGDATSTVELASISGPIAGTTSCFVVTTDETITLTSDGSTLLLEEEGTACLPGNSIQAPFPFPVDADGTFTVMHGNGVFRGAKGGGTLDCTMAAGDQQHCAFSGTLTLP